MKKLILTFVVCLALTGCVADNKYIIQFTDGTQKTVYGLSKYDTYVEYYESADNASQAKSAITIPMTSIKSLTSMKNE